MKQVNTDAMMQSDSTPQKRRGGVRKGGPNPGGFRRGHDERRGYKYRVAGRSLTEIAREHLPRCVELWRQAMDDELCPWPARLRASELMAERGAGKPVSQIELNVTANRPLESLSTQELEQIAAGVTVEGEFTALPAPDGEEQAR